MNGCMSSKLPRPRGSLVFGRQEIILRIGTRKFSAWIELYKGKTDWHTGKYTLILAKGYYVDGAGWGWTDWRFIPLGRKVPLLKNDK